MLTDRHLRKAETAALGLLGETLHGKPPTNTIMGLAAAVAAVVPELFRLRALAQAVDEMVGIGKDTRCYGDDAAFENVADVLEAYQHPKAVEPSKEG